MSDSPSRIYLDNGATSWPKPEAVYEAVDRYQRENGSPFGRGNHDSGAEVQRLVTNCRQRVAKLLGVGNPQRVIFTSNATDSLNLAIHGLIKPGDHVVTTILEHNSVSRPLTFREDHHGLEVTRIEPDDSGLITPDSVRAACRENTRLISIIHASNVTGTIQPIQQIGELVKDLKIPVLVDAAQTAGAIPINFESLPIDMLACAGHKGLLGPLGTGILCLSPEITNSLQPVRQGGTGTQSELASQPENLPARFESGNHNVPGLVGLHAGVGYLLEVGVEQIQLHEQTLKHQLLEGLDSISGVTVHAKSTDVPQLGVLSVTSDLYDPQTLATLLSQEFGVETRAGLHCAPGVHEWLRTKSTGGTVRLSVGPFVTLEQIELTVNAFKTLHQF
ncbi:MAG: aminotransferase class V-fold PLP-dependent enzyme [Planctomycetaceae bacterium]|nr:aminotransferase class V-fold PLP-dependent enzyme [Planctomycetaceae bacterium]